jgi:hypothetical protein
VKFLGHTISSEGISVDPTKVQEVMNWKPPTSVHQIRSFLRLAGCYHQFIPDFSKIAKSMTELLKKEVKFCWDDMCEEAFHTLRKLLTTAPVLAQPDNTQPFDVYCDASGTGLVVFLCKTTESLLMHPEHSEITNKTTQPMILNWQLLFMLSRSGGIILWAPSVTFTLTIRASNISSPKLT